MKKAHMKKLNITSKHPAETAPCSRKVPPYIRLCLRP